MEFTYCTNYKGIDVVLYITAVDYSAGRPATGPSYSCAGEPPEYASAVATDGYVTLDGTVSDMGPLTSEEMDVIMDITNDNSVIFEAICDSISDELEDALIDFIEESEGPDNYYEDDDRY